MDQKIGIHARALTDAFQTPQKIDNLARQALEGRSMNGESLLGTARVYSVIDFY